MAKKEKIPHQTAPPGWNNPFDELNDTPASERATGSVEPNGFCHSVPLPPQDAAPRANPKQGRVVLRRETAHRGGKTVTIIYDFPTHLPLSKLEDLSRQLKKACGCGGTLKDREIEMQGDLVPRIRAWLEAEGFRVAGVR